METAEATIDPFITRDDTRRVSNLPLSAQPATPPHLRRLLIRLYIQL